MDVAAQQELEEALEEGPVSSHTRGRSRAARRSGCTARVIIGASEEIGKVLEAEDDSFFGESEESATSSCTRSLSGSESDEPPAKRPRVEDSWVELEGESSAEESGGDTDSASDDEDDEQDALQSVAAVDSLILQGCGCVQSNHYSSFTSNSILHYQDQVSAMKSKELDIFLIGVLAARCTRDDPVVHNQSTASAASAADPERTRITFGYTVMGHIVCRTAFMKLHMVGRTRLRRLQLDVENGSCHPGAHGNVGNVPWNKFPAEVGDRAQQFILNYSLVFGLPMPAAPRGRGEEAPIYLPASATYKSVHSEYVKQSGEAQTLGYRAFLYLWTKKCKSIKFMTRRMDVCNKCELLRDDIRSARAEDEKISATEALRDHVVLAQKEREFYTTVIEQASESLVANPANPEFTHLTFDFAEQFVLPQHAKQPGPVYYKVMFRVNDFGIVNEASKEQIHHLYHEGQTMGEDNKLNHNPNCVISMLHAYLESSVHGRKLHLHCDNCCGQNKNKTMMAYLCWRLLCGLEDQIDISFMVVGHTRCSVDGGFGLAKQKYRLGDIDTMEQLVSVVTESACSNVASTKNWEWRDWDSFLQGYFKRLAGITQYQHFNMTKEQPGKIKMKKTSAAEEGDTIQLLRNPSDTTGFSSSSLPDVLPEAGLSALRRKYLLDNVAGFCHAENKAAFTECLGQD